MSPASQPAGLAPIQRGLDRIALERVIMAAIAGGTGWLSLACGAVLLLRRLAGGVTAIPGPAALALVCLVGAFLVTVGDLAAQAACGPRRFTARIGLMLAVFATALPLPAGRPVAATLAVASLVFAAGVLAEPWVGRRKGRGRPAIERPASPVEPSPSRAVAAPSTAWPSDREQSTLDGAAVAGDGHLIQHLERFLRDDGTECVRGRLFLAVPAGVRSASAHVGFCPPFATMPTAEVNTAYDEVEAIVAAADVLPWGIRVECRLDEPADEAFEIPIDFFASSPPSPHDMTPTT